MGDKEPGDPNREPRTTITPEEARQGKLVLRTATRRRIFISGLVLFAILAFVAALL